VNLGRGWLGCIGRLPQQLLGALADTAVQFAIGGAPEISAVRPGCGLQRDLLFKLRHVGMPQPRPFSLLPRSVGCRACSHVAQPWRRSGERSVQTQLPRSLSRSSVRLWHGGITPAPMVILNSRPPVLPSLSTATVLTCLHALPCAGCSLHGPSRAAQRHERRHQGRCTPAPLPSPFPPFLPAFPFPRCGHLPLVRFWV